MTSHEYRQGTFSPRMYPEEADTTRPVPPVRAEFQSNNPQEESLLPRVPPRMDEPGQTSTISRQVRKKMLIVLFFLSIEVE